MTIQIITKEILIENFFGNYLISTFENLKSLDEFDVNIIDLSSKLFWEYSGTTYTNLNISKDLISLRTMIDNSKKTKIVFIFPQNINFNINYDRITSTFVERTKIKDCIRSVEKILNELILGVISLRLIYEPTKTILNEIEYSADFYFNIEDKIITKSQKSEKTTTFVNLKKINRDIICFYTTLTVLKSNDDLRNFLSTIFPNPKEEIPQWAQDYNFYDDDKQKDIITDSKEIINQEKIKITDAENRISENIKYKSILYTNGDELVSVVYEIIEKLIKFDLSSFKDEKKEDFRIKSDNITFIGEIKGVTSNVKSEHISQLDVHYQSYKDELDNNDVKENVKSLLIINPLRNKPLQDREEIHENQINLAVRNKSLIIETRTLLKIYEKFLQEEITTEKCIELFESKTGLLKEEDLDNSKKEN